MKCHRSVTLFWLVLGRCVERVSEPTAVCVLGYHRFPLKGEPLRLAPWKARISLVITFGLCEKHFVTLCDSGNCINFGYLEIRHL